MAMGDEVEKRVTVNEGEKRGNEKREVKPGGQLKKKASEGQQWDLGDWRERAKGKRGVSRRKEQPGSGKKKRRQSGSGRRVAGESPGSSRRRRFMSLLPGVTKKERLAMRRVRLRGDEEARGRWW